MSQLPVQTGEGTTARAVEAAGTAGAQGTSASAASAALGATAAGPRRGARQPRARPGSEPPRALSAQEPVPRPVGQAILDLIGAWNGQLPPSSAAGILRGDEACSVVWNYGSARFAQFGALRSLPYRDLVRAIQLMLLKGLLRHEPKGRNRLKLWLTAEGERARAAEPPTGDGTAAGTGRGAEEVGSRT